MNDISATRRARALARARTVVERLRRANERLEALVAERTRELAEANRRLLAGITEREEVNRERRRALAEERSARTQAEAANRAKEDFLAVLSHELRTPLNAIQGWAHILGQEDVEPHVVRRGAAVIARNVAAQERLIESLLDSARIAAKRIRIETCRVRLADIVREVVVSVRPAAAEKGVDLRITVADAVHSAEVNGDPRRLTQIVMNLVSNALKFTPSGGRIDVQLDRSGQRLRLRVADTGEGIAPEFLPYLFTRFRQADGSSRRRAGGLGLGLALVKELVDLHGGTIEATSPGAGRGTTLVVKLPEAAPEQAAARGASLSGASGDARPATGRLTGCKVIVIDDHADTLDAMRAILELEGARASTARTVNEALECLTPQLAHDCPDVVLCDIELPEEDGYAFLERLRAIEARAGTPDTHCIPVVAVTAYAGEQHRARALAAGFAMHVAKPIDAGRLVAAVQETCTYGRSRDQE